MDTSQEVESLMQFLPNLNSKSAVQIGAFSLGLTNVLLQNNLTKLKIVANEEAKLKNEASNNTEFVAVNDAQSRRKFELNEKYLCLSRIFLVLCAPSPKNPF